MAPKIDDKSGLRRGCVFGAFWGGLGRQKGDRPNVGTDHFGSHFPSKIKKWHPKNHLKIDAEEVSKNDAKWTKNEAKMEPKIDDFQVF